MGRIITFLVLLITATITAQDAEDTQVKLAIDTFFVGFHKGDTTLMKSVMYDKIHFQTTYINKEGKGMLVTEESSKLILAIANRPVEQKWDERLLDYKIQIDGTMAHVWTPYEFWVNGQFSHCGVNSFQLFKDDGNWKIIYLIDTRRREGCQE
ncbi:3-methyl-2-oxobutanoate hydroxymethyltransferase [Flavobacteriaceae bacterium LYZ1037]|nr:3-methyl-2-oxobutanoate hydroxymethyltransferase [Flavobacteriaceae bacterium LYZ1037]